MKMKSCLLLPIVLMVLTPIVSAVDGMADSVHAEGHAHQKKTAGPNGGRVLMKVDPHAEFFVLSDRKVQITFLGDDGKVIAPGAQVITVTAGSRAAPTKLNFSRLGDVLLSDAALPEGNNFPAVVQIKVTAEAKAVIEKFNVNLSTCSGCSLAEYACTCGH
jgi:hypothetical protein